jgi:tetratricopeptide (TPR) repeat protein
MKEILRLKRAIILIDDFYVPGKPFDYDSYQGARLDLNYISDLIHGRSHEIYYTSIGNRDNRGMAIIFIGYKENDIHDTLKGLPLIKENLENGTLSLLGKSGRVLLMGIGKHKIRSAIPTQFFENYVGKCISGCEIITFGYNKGVDICIKPEDDFNKVVLSLPNGWMPDFCILPNCEFNFLPVGIEHAPFPTVYIAYDWDYQIHTARTFVESADLTLVFGDFARKTLHDLGANNIEIFYPHGAVKDSFSLSPKKIKDRKYDILYTTFVDDVIHPDRSAWIHKLCELSEKYKVKIVSHASSSDYHELLQNSKLAFSHQRFGEMSIRIYEYSSQGTVTLETGAESGKYFLPNEEYIPVTKENIEVQVKKYLENEDLLQKMSERAYKKALEKYEPRKLFIELLEVIYKQLSNNTISTRKFKGYSDDKKHIRRGEINYYLFFRGVKGGILLISNNNYVEFLLKSIQEFKRAVDKKPTPRALLNLSIANASSYFCLKNHEPYSANISIKESIYILEELLYSHPSYAMGYFHLGFIHSRLGNYKEALEIFAKALEVFKDPGSHVDPWCIYPAETDSDPKNNFILGKPLNTALLLLSRGDEDKAICNIRNLYQAAIHYYLSIIYEKNGLIHRSVEALQKSHNLYPDSGIVATQVAKRLTILGFKEESLTMYKKAIELLPFDIDLRIEYIRLLYIYQIDRELPDEIKNVFKITKTMTKFRDKTAILNDMIKNFNRYHTPSNYSHDSCKERILSEWVEILFTYLRKDPKNLKLVSRIIDIWYELGRVDKVFELLEDYIYKQNGNGKVDNAINSTLNKINKDLQDICNLRKGMYKEKLERLNKLAIA